MAKHNSSRWTKEELIQLWHQWTNEELLREVAFWRKALENGESREDNRIDLLVEDLDAVIALRGI